MALKGTLKDFGIADILQLIGQQQKTGTLHLKAREEEVHVSFNNNTRDYPVRNALMLKRLLGQPAPAAVRDAVNGELF